MTYERICVFLVSACGVLALVYGLLTLAGAVLIRYVRYRRVFEAFFKFAREYHKEKGWSSDE
jgi:hypothetical protein